ncbi:MAG: S-layer homology domain-containing protein, partial [Monoglobales bacterium]
MKRKTNRILSVVLAFVMVVSVMCMNVSASNDYQGHWARNAIDFVIENGFWTDEGDFKPDQPITRAEFSALLVRTLKTAVLDYVPPFDDVSKTTPYYQEIYSAYKSGLIKGDGKNFKPNDTLTRQEAAAILDRASFIINGKTTTSEIEEGRFTDFEQIDEWARQSVFNAIKGGLMQGSAAKKFSAQGKLTRAECATISQRISEMRKLDKLDFTVRDAKEGEEKNFSVINDGRTYTDRGVSGFAVLARFEKGPGEIFFSRTMSGRTLSPGPWEASALCKVIDPDGNMIAIYDFSHMKSGTEKKVIKVNIEKPGIYTMQVMNGENDDYFQIGINNPISWGIRAEKFLGGSNTMPKAGYVYTHRKVKYVYVGVSTAQPVSLIDLDGNVVATSTAVSRPRTKHDLYTEKARPETVYQLKFDPNFSGQVVTDGFPGLISPTPEMALDLKGGWSEEEGVITQGPLQKRARKRAVEIVKNENLDVVIDRPAELPRDLQNPIAEAQFFGAYGVISGVGAAAARQVLDPDSPLLGTFMSTAQYTGSAALPTDTFESCYFISSSGGWRGGAAAVSIPLEINYAYGNRALIYRTALNMLHFITEMGEDYEDRDKNFYTSYSSMVSMFAYDAYIESYIAIKNFLDADTRDILFQGVVAIGNKMMDYPGQGVTNQGFFHPLNNLRLYNELGCDPQYEYLHSAFKRQMIGMMEVKNDAYGYHEGHFIESGFDSSYEYMNREEWSE